MERDVQDAIDEEEEMKGLYMALAFGGEGEGEKEEEEEESEEKEEAEDGDEDQGDKDDEEEWGDGNEEDEEGKGSLLSMVFFVWFFLSQNLLNRDVHLLGVWAVKEAKPEDGIRAWAGLGSVGAGYSEPGF